MIELKDVSMHYTLGESDIPVLKDLNLSISQGERVAIAGPSGSGKTTLLLLLAGMEQPSSGWIEIDHVPLGSLKADELADLRCDRIGIVFQSFHLVPSLNAMENVALPLEIAGKRDAREKALALLEKVGLSGRRYHFPSQLSGGEQQRVAIARALVHSPKLVLADEPTGNLDDKTGEAVGQLLFDLNEQTNTTLVLVTHDLELARRCDRVLRLHNGILSQALTGHHDAVHA